MNRSFSQIGLGITFGAGLGAATAVLLGSGGAWLAIGIAVGLIIGAAMFRKNLHKPNGQKLTTND
jgi:CBS-domain-containing membrane protein